METKPLLYGIIGFFIGGLLVSVAATTFDKPQTGDMTMASMTDSLKNKTGDAYDALFIEHMIAHHQAAVDMAKLSESRAGHNEIKRLSRDIVTAQQAEIDQMRLWQRQWGYAPGGQHSGMSH